MNTAWRSAESLNDHFISFFLSSQIYSDIGEREVTSLDFALQDVAFNQKQLSNGSGSDFFPGGFSFAKSEVLSFHENKLFCYISPDSIFPSQWKDSFVEPLIKSGARNPFVSNRQVSNLSKLSLAFDGINFASL